MSGKGLKDIKEGNPMKAEELIQLINSTNSKFCDIFFVIKDKEGEYQKYKTVSDIIISPDSENSLMIELVK